MPKRERGNDESGAEDDRAQKIRKTRLRAKVEQGNKAIASALKLARGFERQKLGRRQKTAKDDAQELLRLNDEVGALKALDLGQTAAKYLFKQLAKTKRIKESPTFVSLYGVEPVVEAPKPGAQANVMGRLFNSNPIKQVMPGIMKGILGCLGLEPAVGSGGGKNNTAVQPFAHEKAKFESRPAEEEEFENGFEGFSAEDDTKGLPLRNVKTGAKAVEDSEDDELAKYNIRLASDSSDSASLSSDIFQASSQVQNGTHNHSILSKDISASPSPTRESMTRSSTKEAKPILKPSGTTTFLPSLMMGGYYSGSDSDGGGDEFIKAGQNPLQPKLRKNRRGQRARQEIAEKKYGNNANHLKKLAVKEARSRDAGWDARKGATDGSGRQHGLGNRIGGRGNNRKLTGANSDDVVRPRDFGAGTGKVAATAKENGGPLHPSWEAAKKRKEQGLGRTAAFNGKKITFD